MAVGTRIDALSTITSLSDADLLLLLTGDGETNGLTTVAAVRDAVMSPTLATLGTITGFMSVGSTDPKVARRFGLAFESANWLGNPLRNDGVAYIGWSPDDPNDHFAVVMEDYYFPSGATAAVSEIMVRHTVNGVTKRLFQINGGWDEARTSQAWFDLTNWMFRTSGGTPIMYTRFDGVDPDVVYFDVDVMAKGQYRTNHDVDGNAPIEVRQPATILAAGDDSTRYGITIRNQAAVANGGYALNTATPIIALSIENQLATGALSIKAADLAIFSGGMEISDVDSEGAILTVATVGTAALRLTTTGYKNVRNFDMWHNGLNALFKNTSGSFEFRRFDDGVLLYVNAGNYTISTANISGSFGWLASTTPANGDWRAIRSGANLVFQVRSESVAGSEGTWTTRLTVTAAD